ncbi:MAG: (p)ppGpp synthetase [Prochlorococcus sp. SP3034]|nr:(p)ppGpp synthetase [Prochlorococcus sp. SP3034]|tara:strand:- start:7940 stop:10258 length:2319 start_codon:yes stop_codon:yes gene_type:complete
MFEAKANSNEKRNQKVSKTILPEKLDFESESFEYGIKLPDWLLDIIKNYKNSIEDSDSNKNIIYKAFKLAYKSHYGQYRASGEPYIIHPIAVADLLKEIGASNSVIAAGLLHDVVEDTGVPLSDIEKEFGQEVKILVEGVTKLGGIHFTNRTEAQAENLRKMFLAMARDIRVVLVKLADRLHNMRTIEWLNEERKKRIARETREIYAPLANRIGINRFKWELEDLAFKFLEPDDYENLKNQIALKRSDRENRLNKTLNLIKDNLISAGLEEFDIDGRPKHLYGIWSKMKRQQKQFKEIYDVAALRIIVSNTDSCYRALAVVHDTFKPIPGRFKDYIGLPKPNGYQSLHTSVIGKYRPIEIQIRTFEMHQVAEFGIAAHWKYKEGGSPAAGKTERFNWLRQLVEWQQEENENDHNNYLASIKEDLFDEEVFVITPRGDVVSLRKGSTAIDFAYRIHSEIGNHCNGIRINEKLSPLSTLLRNGDFVEILTSHNSSPSLDWLNFVVTPTAKNRIRQWYKKSHREDTIKRGRDLLEKEIGKSGFEALITSEAMKKVSNRCNLKTTEDLLASLGYGGLTLHQVLNRLREEIKILSEENKKDNDIDLVQNIKEQNNNIKFIPKGNRSSPIAGIEGLDFRIGKCCSPLPGEEIVGAVSLGNHGITIHRRDCENINPIPYERRLPVCWNEQEKKNENKFPIQLRIEVIDRVGVLKDILMRLSDKSINVSDASVKTAQGKPAIINLCVELESLIQLNKTIEQIKTMADVIDIARVEQNNKS